MDYFSQIRQSHRIRRPLSILNVFGLSVCIGASLLIFLYVWSELSYDSFHNGAHVYRAESRLYEGDILTDNWATTTYGHAPVMKREIPGIETYVRITAQDREQVVSYFERQFTEEAYCYTEPAFFEIFNFPLVRGETSGQLLRPHTVVVSESAAHRYFGDSEPLGKILTFRTATSQQTFEVTGVMADMPTNSHLRYDFLLSYSSIPAKSQDIWYIHGVYTYLRLTPQKSPADIEADFGRLSDKYKTDALKHKTWAVELIPLTDIHLTPQKAYEKEIKGSRTAIAILLVMAVVLLVIGWANALNLTIARFLERGKEFGLRKVFGASRRQIITQGLLESGITHLLAGFIALGWLELLLPLIYRWTNSYFGTTLIAHAPFWLLFLIILLIGTLFTGLYPSLLMLKIRPSEIMRGTLLHGKRGNRMRKLLIVVQFIASFVLVTGTITVIAQIRYMRDESAQPMMHRMLIVKHPSFTPKMELRMESFKKRLQQEPDIESVALSGAVPGVEVANYFTNRPFGSDPSQVKLIQMFAVDCNYLSTYAQELVCGRGFSETYGDEPNKVVLNEEAARLLGYPSPHEAIGKQLKMEILAEPLEIIGIAKNYHQQSMAVAYKPILFFLKEKIPFIATPYISILFKGNPNQQQVEMVEKLYQQYFPDSLFQHFFLNELTDQLYKQDRNFGWIFAAASLLAIFVACLGLWVVALFSALSRLREIGIRKILGAGKITLFWVLTRELLLLTLVASAISVPLSAFLLTSWLETYAFHITLSWWMYLLTFGILTLIATFTLLQQVWRTIRLKPMRILKSE